MLNATKASPRNVTGSLQYSPFVTYWQASSIMRSAGPGTGRWWGWI